MRKLKRMNICFLLVFVMTFLFPLSAFAQSTSQEEFKENCEEINEYLKQHSTGLELKEQVVKYTIPLSSGGTATVTYELKKKSNLSRTEYEAELGVWDFISTWDFPLHGSIKVTTTVNIYHVPNKNSTDMDMVRFEAYNGRVEATPLQGTTVTGTSANTERVAAEIQYQTTGYVGFSVSSAVLNYYYTQEIISMGNTGDNRTKIGLFMSVEL